MRESFRSAKPKYRSKARVFFGKCYFTLRRYITWGVHPAVKYSRRMLNIDLPFQTAHHQTPLYRQLKDVEMWLQENKVTNLKLAAARMDRVVVKPGETFSFWRLVGKPTERKGYKAGMVLSNGEFHPGIGGGLCQLSNLIYWMTLHTPLTVKERWRHTHDIFPDAHRTQPFGSGATVVYNYVDLQIRNDTQDDYELRVWVGESSLFGEWRCGHENFYSYEIYEIDHHITHEWWGGYMRHNRIDRRIYDAHQDQVGQDEIVVENHAVMMYEPLLSSDNDGQ